MQKEREKFLLFRIYRAKDEKAFAELHSNYESKLLRFFVFKLPTTGDAEEMANEVFLRLWDYLRSSQVDHFESLLYRTARNICADFYRRQGRQLTEAPIEEASTIPDTDTPDLQEQVGTILSGEAIVKLLPKLKEEYRDVILMRFVEDMSIREIALALEKSENNVRVTVHRALKTIRRLLDQAV